jgi:hypothetical protein
LRDGLVNNLPHGQRDDDQVFVPEELVDLAQSVAAEVEANHETLLPLGPYDRRFKAVDAGAADLVLNTSKLIA